MAAVIEVIEVIAATEVIEVMTMTVDTIRPRNDTVSHYLIPSIAYRETS